MSFLNNSDTSPNLDLNPDFIRDVVTPAEKNVAQRKVAAEAEKVAARRRSLARQVVPPSASFLSGLFGSKKNKKSNKKKSIKKSNKKESNTKKN